MDFGNQLLKSLKHRDFQSFVLRGHGVPLQLLRDHLDLCGQVLWDYKAVQCNFANFNFVDGDLDDGFDW